MPSAMRLPLRSRSMGQTPIYEQLRGERINADVPSSHPDLLRPARPARHRLDPETPGPAPAVAHHQQRAPTHPPAHEEREAGRGGRAPAAIPSEVHARTTAPRHPGPSFSTPTAGYSPAALTEMAGGGALGGEQVERARPSWRTDPPAAATARATVFPWFDALKIP